jgi:WD40 repeat protein
VLFSGGSAGLIEAWNVAAGERFLTLDGHQGLVKSLAISRDDAWLASGGSDAIVRLWDA